MIRPDPTREISRSLDLNRPDPHDFENLLSRPDPTRPVTFRTRPDPTRHDNRHFETLLTRPTGRVMTLEKPCNIGAYFYVLVREMATPDFFSQTGVRKTGLLGISRWAVSSILAEFLCVLFERAR